jgi:hypothetical protein
MLAITCCLFMGKMITQRRPFCVRKQKASCTNSLCLLIQSAANALYHFNCTVCGNSKGSTLNDCVSVNMCPFSVIVETMQT